MIDGIQGGGFPAAQERLLVKDPVKRKKTTTY